MRYVIDGYNLLHAMGVLLGRAGPHRLESARLALLDRVLALHGDRAADVTVVFDAAKAPARVEAEQDHKGVRVLFALHEEADDVIEALIRSEPAPHQLTIVSDDRRLREAARRRKCVSTGCLDYLEQVGRPPPPTRDADGPAKPQRLSAEEMQLWMKEFADLADDPRFKGLVEFEAPPDEDD